MDVLLTFFATSLGLSSQARRQEPAESKPLRFDLTPLIGYRTSVTSLIQPEVRGSNARIVFERIRVTESHSVYDSTKRIWSSSAGHERIRTFISKTRHKLPRVKERF